MYLEPENDLEFMIINTLDPCVGCTTDNNVYECAKCPKIDIASDFDYDEVLRDYRGQVNSLHP